MTGERNVAPGLRKSILQELQAVEKCEQRLEAKAHNTRKPNWKAEIESRIPPKVYTGLESAFAKGFSIVFQQGRKLIEQTYNKIAIQDNYSIRDFTIHVKGGRRELRQLRSGASRSNLWNMTVTTSEGVALGVLGIGMPDIVLFLSTLLKGIYETALNYGFSYEAKEDQYWILKMMETALSTGEKWNEGNNALNHMMDSDWTVTDLELRSQIQKTASAFVMDMLLLKFVQGIPVVGILGGAANPVYYRKVMCYVQVKYHKRYLLRIGSTL